MTEEFWERIFTYGLIFACVGYYHFDPIFYIGIVVLFIASLNLYLRK